MPANPEVQIKALEKKMSAYDKKFDQYDKQLKQVDYSALVKKLGELDKKNKELEQKNKELEKMLFTVASSLKEVKDPSKLLAKAGALNEKSAAKLSMAIAEKENQKLIKQVNKDNEEAIKKAMAHFEKINIDVRLKALEGIVKSMAR